MAQNLTTALKVVYKGKCQYCGARGAGHADHIIPKARGGLDTLDNLILACASCNLRKGAGEIHENYLALITAIASKNKSRVDKALMAQKERKNTHNKGKFVHLGFRGAPIEYLYRM